MYTCRSDIISLPSAETMAAKKLNLISLSSDMKQLMENWRRFLKEGIDPRIQKQIDMLLALPDDIGVVIEEIDTWVKAVSYVRFEGDGKWKELSAKDSAVRKDRKIIKMGFLPAWN